MVSSHGFFGLEKKLERGSHVESDMGRLLVNLAEEEDLGTAHSGGLRW